MPKHRWRGPLVDSRTWAWQLSRPLQPGERCIFSAKSGYTSPTGETFSGKNRFELQGAAPRPWRIVPAAGQPIEEDQAFVINGDSALDAKSLEQNLQVRSRRGRPASPRRARSRTPSGARCSTASAAWATRRSLSSAASGCRPAAAPGWWGKGIKAANGTPTEKEESFVYTVREPFKASLTCEREKAGAACSPLSGLTLDFNASFDAALIDRSVLRTPDGMRKPTDPNRNNSNKEASFRSVRFPGPLPQNAESPSKSRPGSRTVPAARSPTWPAFR